MSLYEAVKDLAGIAQKADNIELFKKILDLQAQALTEQEEKARLQERVRELERQVQRLEEDLDFAGSLKYDQTINAYRRDGEGEDARELFCSRCWDVERKAVRLHNYKNGYWGCPSCKNSIEYGRRPY